SRPHCGNKITAVFSLAEITVFYALLIDVISFFNFYPRVNNRNKADMLVFHFLYKRRKVFKITVHGEIFVRVHIVDIHIDHIQRKVAAAVALRDFFEILPGFIAPAALSEAEREFWRNIASADDVTELFYN